MARSRTGMAAVALALLAAAGCGRDSDWRNPAVTQAADSRAEAAYLAPPSVIAVARGRGAITVTGLAEPGSRVRLGTPSGEARFANADPKGAWKADLPDAAPDSGQVQLYGLSMTVAGRTVQSEGYVAVLPDGQVVRLRSGAGAVPLASGRVRLRILAIDYDRDGGAMVSGIANPGAALVLRVDGVESPGAADARGWFSIAASQPVSPQSHQIIVGGDGEAQATIDATRAEPLGQAAMRAQRTASGWRIDWVTPGGGVQTTIILAA